MILLDALEDFGYKIQLMGEALKLTFTREGTPDPARVAPLLEAIKIHKKEVVEHLRKEADFEKIFKYSLEQINGKYVPGTIPYIKGNYPELWHRLIEVENSISEAWLAGKEGEFKKIVNEYILVNLQAAKVFKERNVQGQLFEETK